MHFSYSNCKCSGMLGVSAQISFGIHRSLLISQIVGLYIPFQEEKYSITMYNYAIYSINGVDCMLRDDRWRMKCFFGRAPENSVYFVLVSLSSALFCPQKLLCLLYDLLRSQSLTLNKIGACIGQISVRLFLSAVIEVIKSTSHQIL
jgi:hypothetical protein